MLERPPSFHHRLWHLRRSCCRHAPSPPYCCPRSPHLRTRRAGSQIARSRHSSCHRISSVRLHLHHQQKRLDLLHIAIHVEWAGRHKGLWHIDELDKRHGADQLEVGVRAERAVGDCIRAE